MHTLSLTLNTVIDSYIENGARDHEQIAEAILSQEGEHLIEWLWDDLHGLIADRAWRRIVETRNQEMREYAAETILGTEDRDQNEPAAAPRLAADARLWNEPWVVRGERKKTADLTADDCRWLSDGYARRAKAQGAMRDWFRMLADLADKNNAYVLANLRTQGISLPPRPEAGESE